MIVRNEAHIVREVLDSVAPYISSWVVVDTGSDDGTQEVIRSHMAGLGIPGELHERAWVNFGHNRSEALALAQGHGDYIWSMDADDIVVGTIDFRGLTADVYMMRIGGDFMYWRRGLFRDGMPWHYKGVVHEYADCERPFVEERLEGDYYVESRRLGARNKDPQKYARDAELLLAEVQRNPYDARSAFYLAQSYFDGGDIANARLWYSRRAEMAGWDEETYLAKFRLAESMSRLEEPWPSVQDAYLSAWEFRPVRAEPLHAIAFRYRTSARYRLGYLFAERAASIPLPNDTLFVSADVYAFRALDEQAVCASWIGRHAEAFALCRRLLARADIPDGDRRRIAANRDLSAPAVLEAASSYPDALAQNLVAGPRNSEVTVSLIAGPDRAATELTLNSFLRCCTDVARAGRFVVLAAGLSAEDRAVLLESYRFLEFITAGAPDTHVAQLRAAIGGRFWLHVGQGWRFFAADDLIARLTGVLEAEPDVFQVGVNFGDAAKLTGESAAEAAVRRTRDGSRYVVTDAVANGPAMYEMARLNRALGDENAEVRAATLDEVLCVNPD